MCTRFSFGELSIDVFLSEGGSGFGRISSFASYFGYLSNVFDGKVRKYWEVKAEG